MKSLAMKNLRGRPVRSAVLIVLAALLTFTALGGTLTVASLGKGLDSLEARLGADVMVVPKEATMKKKFEDIVLQGATGYFYMDSKRAQAVMEREGVGEVSPQFFLASTGSSCCSIPVQIIGIDPATDFTVSPWIKRTYGGELGLYDIVAGSDLNAFVGDKLSFYGVECRVAAKLEKTGTSYDTTVFTNEDTIKALISSSLEKGMNDFEDVDPENCVSCLMINAADGTSPEELVNDINIHVKKVKAYKSGDMISGIAGSLSGVSRMIKLLIAAVWVLGLVILLLAFTMSVNERKKEFAVLRVMGASRGKLAGLVLKEALLTCLTGSLGGAAVGLLVLIPFNGVIEQTLGLPFLLPNFGSIAGICTAAVVLSVLTGAAAAAVSAWRVSRIDTGLILRGEN
ncbi:FtsX-like permease family protein [Ruminococcus sp.]|uniref:ABC transporter permease n=1 Tax=Ruminococcus sp. TaxID=41978 RepID=UPI0025EF9484|nr:FtsX-like permease family protein [Ruminococcus sp.]MBQ8966091.1 FtsX-like permease family protein [Ruminococcus sp.]